MSNRIKLPKRKHVSYEKVENSKRLNKVVTFKREAKPSLHQETKVKRSGLFKRRKK